jgi:hypothetical protein
MAPDRWGTEIVSIRVSVDFTDLVQHSVTQLKEIGLVEARGRYSKGGLMSKDFAYYTLRIAYCEHVLSSEASLQIKQLHERLIRLYKMQIAMQQADSVTARHVVTTR